MHGDGETRREPNRGKRPFIRTGQGAVILTVHAWRFYGYTAAAVVVACGMGELCSARPVGEEYVHARPAAAGRRPTTGHGRQWS